MGREDGGGPGRGGSEKVTASHDFPLYSGGRWEASAARGCRSSVTRASVVSVCALSACAGLILRGGYAYTVVLEREPDGGFVASVPVLPGCVSQGDSRDEALRNIQEAIEQYIEDCHAAGGDPVPDELGREFVELKTGT
jgi:predicted RNase H-like HicB family nuclease